jgi:hypothetical protein
MAKKVLKKAQDGDNIKRTEYNKDKELSEVTKREGFGEQMKKFYKADMAKADSAKTKVGKIARKAVNTITKVAFTPHRIVLNAAEAASNAIANRKEAKAMDKKKMGGMIKRADGSMSKRGLWDNIRANKGSGKKPTSAMLKQEKKIKAQTKKK